MTPLVCTLEKNGEVNEVHSQTHALILTSACFSPTFTKGGACTHSVDGHRARKPNVHRNPGEVGAWETLPAELLGKIQWQPLETQGFQGWEREIP